LFVFTSHFTSQKAINAISTGSSSSTRKDSSPVSSSKRKVYVEKVEVAEPEKEGKTKDLHLILI
jgi:hypothetical protein